ncbi:MAG: hypothetical protein GF364_20820 [Candidatus Lokiarchaeota archaeon]|nr:hypothetical protein [Candidatus Lokiarchaeota archaeon]
MRKKPGIRIIWPQYFDSERSWKMGRRLPEDIAIPLPTADELMQAAISLGYDAYVNPMVKYPKTWWDPPGCLLIDTMGQKKRKVMEKLVEKVVVIRKQKAKEQAAAKKKKKRKKRK